jgi:hypothetical protein
MILPNLCPLVENVPAKEVSMPDPAEILPSLPSVDEPSFESPLDLLDEEERRELHDDLEEFARIRRSAEAASGNLRLS